MSQWNKRDGDRIGLNWRLRNMEGKRSVRSVLFDTNWFKSFFYARLATAMGDRGCLSLFGDKPELHRLFAEHLTAEFKVPMRNERSGRSCDEWKTRPHQPDNHWLDCCVGCCVAASMQGVSLRENQQARAKSAGPRKTFRSAYEEKWGNLRA